MCSWFFSHLCEILVRGLTSHYAGASFCFGAVGFSICFTVKNIKKCIVPTLNDGIITACKVHSLLYYLDIFLLQVKFASLSFFTEQGASLVFMYIGFYWASCAVSFYRLLLQCAFLDSYAVGFIGFNVQWSSQGFISSGLLWASWKIYFYRDGFLHFVGFFSCALGFTMHMQGLLFHNYIRFLCRGLPLYCAGASLWYGQVGFAHFFEVKNVTKKGTAQTLNDGNISASFCFCVLGFILHMQGLLCTFM